MKKINNLITAKTLVECVKLEARRANVNCREANAKMKTTMQVIYNLMHRLEQVPKGVVQKKQTKIKWQ